MVLFCRTPQLSFSLILVFKNVCRLKFSTYFLRLSLLYTFLPHFARGFCVVISWFSGAFGVRFFFLPLRGGGGELSLLAFCENCQRPCPARFDAKPFVERFCQVVRGSHLSKIFSCKNFWLRNTSPIFRKAINVTSHSNDKIFELRSFFQKAAKALFCRHIDSPTKKALNQSVQCLLSLG